MKKIPQLLAALAFWAAVHSLHAELRVPAQFSDHMILQRGIAVPVWGLGASGETITVDFAGQTKTATVAADGKWMLKMDPLEASSEAREFLVKSPSSTLKFTDVLVGDVWLASGQSNMDSPLSSGSAAQALPTANDPLLRFFKVTKTVAAEPAFEPKGQWQLTTPENARGFSAVAYFFAQEIRRTQNVPVGVFNAAWGGTPIQTWMSLESIRREPAIAKTLTDWETALAQHLSVQDKGHLMTQYLADMRDWEATVMPAWKAAQKAHNVEMDAARAAGLPLKPGPKPERPEPTVPDPIAMPAPSKRPSTPTISYNGMIAPLAPYGLKGVIWYQGEADASRGPQYRVWFPRLIEGWRAAWGQGDFPFLYVQLPGNGSDPAPVAPVGIPFLREAQTLALKLPQTGMAVTIDIGDPKDVHPDNKSFTGARLALVGRRVAYGENILASGPHYNGCTIEEGTVKLRFLETGSGLTIGQAPWVAAGNTAVPTDKLAGFFIAGADQKWVGAEAVIEGDTVKVSSPQVPVPVAVRYAWANSPRGNLYNKEGLPAGPFRTDEEP
jgi:sialate O-acetylesterase